MLRGTLLFLLVQTLVLTVGFALRLDWVFPYLALVNLAAGPAALFLGGVRR